jgi:hypothetical protein
LERGLFSPVNIKSVFTLKRLIKGFMSPGFMGLRPEKNAFVQTRSV